MESDDAGHIVSCQADVAAIIIFNAISHNGNPMTERCEEGAQKTGQALVVFPQLPATGLERSPW